jgi:hypothetical protein
VAECAWRQAQEAQCKGAELTTTAEVEQMPLSVTQGMHKVKIYSMSPYAALIHNHLIPPALMTVMVSFQMGIAYRKLNIYHNT